MVPGVSTNIAMLLVAGSEDSKSSSEVDKLHKQLETLHSKSESKDIFVLKPDVKLSGTKLLDRSLRLKSDVPRGQNLDARDAMIA